MLVSALTAASASQAQGADVYASVSPQGKSIGLGLEVGAPTSLNAKFMTAGNQGIVVGIGGGIWYDLSLSLHADYLWHPFAVPVSDVGTFSGFVGLGAWTSLGNYGPRWGYYQRYQNNIDVFAIGGRVPLGLNFAFHAIPIELFAEVVPSVALFPGIGVFGQGGLGVRFYL